VLHLGDILDGLQAVAGRAASEESLQRVLSAFSPLPVPVHHCIGNHCLVNLPRPVLQAALRTPVNPAARGAAFYSFALGPGFRCVVLDSYDVSLLGWEDQADARCVAARELLAARNGVNWEAGNVNSPSGLLGPDRRFVGFGGGASEGQLEWLQATLAAAQAERERVFVVLHTPLHPASSPPVCLLWNYEQVLSLCAAHSACVATLAGHAHGGGYHCDEAGIHHLVLPAILECEPGTNAFGHLDVYEHGFAVRGTGRLASTPLLPYRAWDAPGEDGDAEAAARIARLAL